VSAKIADINVDLPSIAEATRTKYSEQVKGHQWGGELECKVIADHYQCAIHVFDACESVWRRYGYIGGGKSVVFVLSGVHKKNMHYDVVALDGKPESRHTEELSSSVKAGIVDKVCQFLARVTCADVRRQPVTEWLHIPLS
jgi:hypothetical protein